jgi:hypothetical protein
MNILSVLISIKRGERKKENEVTKPKTVGEKMRSHMFRNGTVCYVELLNYVVSLSLEQTF